MEIKIMMTMMMMMMMMMIKLSLMTIDKKILGDLENSLTFCACMTDIFTEKIVSWK
jgi:hypothetical protein